MPFDGTRWITPISFVIDDGCERISRAWCKGRMRGPNDEVCIIAAVAATAPNQVTAVVVHNRLFDALPADSKFYPVEAALTAYNDAPERTHREVIELFYRAR